MPYQTVNEVLVQERQVLICRSCRCQIGAVSSRESYNTGGSIAGSLGGSMGGSMLGAEVLGPVGMVIGCIGGAVAGSCGGAMASDGICNAVESTADDLCAACHGNETRQRQRGSNSNWSCTARNEQPAPSEGPKRNRWSTKSGKAALAVGSYVSKATAWLSQSLSGSNSTAANPDTESGGSVPHVEPSEEVQAAMARSLVGTGTFARELAELEQMGFEDQDRNLALLLAHNGQVDEVVEALVLVQPQD